MLLPYLRQLLAKGETHLAVTPEARDVLRKIYKGEIAFGEKAAAANSPSSATVAATPQRETMIPRPSTSEERKAPLNIPNPAPHGDTPEEKLANLRDLAEHWPSFRDLGSFRKTLVFSAGPPTADLMLIGDTPGYHEEQKREPFAGPAGEKLNAILKAMAVSYTHLTLPTILLV